MKKYRGIAVSEGYALGPVREWLPNLPEAGTFTHTQSPEKDRPREWARFLQARVGACSHMTELYQQALARVGEHYAGIFKIQLAPSAPQSFTLVISSGWPILAISSTGVPSIVIVCTPL